MSISVRDRNSVLSEPSSPSVEVRKSNRVVRGRKSNFSSGANSNSPLIPLSPSVNAPSASVGSGGSVKSGSSGGKSGGKRRSHVSKDLKMNVSKALMGFEPPSPVDAKHDGQNDSDELSVGIGVYDITGTCVDVGLQGYSKLTQVAQGLHMRLFARAFIFASHHERVCFVSVELNRVQVDVREEVLRLLADHFGNSSLYNERNVMIAATNTYASCGGGSHYLFDSLSTGGYVEDNFRCVTEGIVHAIVRAHNSMISGVSLHFGQEAVSDGNINRSPEAYDKNPEEERKNYDTDTNQVLSLIRISDSKKDDVAALAFYPVAGCASSTANRLVHGDSKGLASYLMEKKVNGPRYVPGTRGFLAAFSQTNCGDASPRIRGPQCSELPNRKCTEEKHVCEFFGDGETDDMSCYVSARTQYKTALNLFLSGCEKELSSTIIASAHQYCCLSGLEVDKTFTGTGSNELLTEPCLGVAYGLGNSDGRGRWPFENNGVNVKSYPIVKMMVHTMETIPDEVVEEQKPKEILLNIERLRHPGPWIPNVFPLQILQIGQLFLVGVPGELSTMAGRRLKESIVDAISPPSENKEDPPIVILVGLANGYIHHVTTREEYQMQAFEGASTLFGAHTLAGLQQEFTHMSKSLISGNGDRIASCNPPQDVSYIDFHEYKPLAYDEVPKLADFGEVIEQPSSHYEVGEVVTVKFWGANPRNDLRTGDTYFVVEKRDIESRSWITVATDANFETRFLWQRCEKYQSKVTVEWEIPMETLEGFYRIRYFGCRLNPKGERFQFTGTTKEFSVGKVDSNCIIS